MNIILLGKPGSGKGTQSKKLVEKYGLIHISTGDLLREEKSKGTELGKQLNLGSGFLVSDEIVINLIKNKINELEFLNNDHTIIGKQKSIGFLFDGFPRTIEQAIELDKFIKIDKAILIILDDEKVIDRIIKRGEKSGREDDTKETAKIRLKEYEDKTYPIKQFYGLNNKLAVVHGDKQIDEVFNDICKLL